ncbi:MAG: biotin--[acetyl-CoA-carboxylase] ligase, partial [Mycobacterium sp.]|nr:biotin--[acetyl-CoA-carboxylase] ligase [Mycobacterium sp.]
MASVDRSPLDAALLNSAISDTEWRRVEVVEETGSTNADLTSRAAAGEDIGGAVLLAEYQSAGRGRHGRSWSAPARSQLSMSVAVATEGVPPVGWGWLPLLTGLVVA